MYSQLYECTADIESVLNPIMYVLCIPKGSRDHVRTICQDIYNRAHNLVDCTVKLARGPTPLIVDYTPQAQIVYELAQSGVGDAQIASILNKQWASSKAITAAEQK